MRNLTYILLATFLLLSLIGCSDDDSGPTGTETDLEEASDQKQFVWNAMNYWYYWQEDVPELQDNYFTNDQEFQNYLKDYSDAEAVFNGLLHLEDDFSFFIDDYEEFEQSQQGIFQAFGYQFGLVQISNNQIFGYVQYVLEDSPAADSGLQRGDIFTSVNGTQLRVQNYQDLLMDETNYELSLAEFQDNTIAETGETVSLQAIELQEDPIHLYRIIEEESTSIGYLMYNAFQLNSHQNLNEVFGTFESEGIDELVVDLRYNGGGTGITSQMLAGMISGLDGSNDFATYSYNSKRASALNDTVSILDEVPVFEDGEQTSEAAMNQLSLNNVYFLVDRGTASASELLINGLEPYIDVVLIGGQTVGKDEGSYTLYDAPAPYFDDEMANPNHMIAIQPIVLKLVNTEGQAYPDGFAPDYEVDELDYLISNNELPPLGSENDPLLAQALEVITGQPVTEDSSMKTNRLIQAELLLDSRDLQPYKKQLFLQPPHLNINNDQPQ